MAVMMVAVARYHPIVTPQLMAFITVRACVCVCAISTSVRDSWVGLWFWTLPSNVPIPVPTAKRKRTVLECVRAHFE